MASEFPRGAKAAAVNLCAPQTIVTITVSSTESKDPVEAQIESLVEAYQKMLYQQLETRDSSYATQALANQEPETTKLFVHKDLLCQNSSFFTAAFNGDFMEGASQAMTLDDVDANTFGVVVNWIYTQKISNVTNEVPNVCNLARVWILAERFLMPALQNATMNHLYKGMAKNGTTCGQLIGLAHIAYNHGDGDHALGKAVQAVLTWGSEPSVVSCAHKLPNKLVLQMMITYKKLQNEESKKLAPGASAFHVAVDEK